MPNDLYLDADRPPALLVGAANDREVLAQAVAAAGGRTAGSVDWADLPDDGNARLIVAALDAVAENEVAPACVALAALIEATDCAAVVTLRQGQIDAAAGILLGNGIDLLCDADDGALAGSIALALARRVDVLADTVREGEEARLRRLNEEVARIAKLLARLSEGEPRGSGVADRVTGFGAPPRAADPVRASDIRNVIRARRLRDQHFTAGLFEDPAWDMLLDLYAAELEGAQVSVSSLCIAAAVPPTTALRWITRMTEAGLFERRPDPFDRRRAFLGLTTDSHQRMDRHFAALAAAGLPLG
ncbi:MAG: hypothetical protein J0I47_15300 [Sphingomonas sp.]|uniref:hypothetical protein n=1 Tax=Sphingomonas sp. TaxID=28214 RepID=UPI001ACCCDB5|nr:hypothetical protein [Sphingomonas sp.]MBN8809584.1 hypothetical protein [Sphingomonas sp.]